MKSTCGMEGNSEVLDVMTSSNALLVHLINGIMM